MRTILLCERTMLSTNILVLAGTINAIYLFGSGCVMEDDISTSLIGISGVPRDHLI